MDGPLEIRFHNLDTSDAMEAAIRERVDKLERLYPRLTRCLVSVEAPHNQHRKGNQWEVHIDLWVPGGHLAVTHEPHRSREKYANPDVYTAMRDAFDVAERQLLDYKRQMNGDVKLHNDFFHGQVSAVHLDRDHGFILTNTGTQLYFHRNSVMEGNMEDLTPGQAVHYVETAGDTGPTAAKVWPVAEHHGS
ncbi:MAG: HPF/RaiA family ribosome-associated protein [Rhodospirillaceae bacterium]|nr:HPF/RaiA family ribosome-associated protein [Rhodospirillales bacterium]